MYYRNGRKYKHRTLILIICQLCQCKSVSTLYLSAGEPLAIVSPRDEKHLKIRVFRKSPTFEFCSALLRSGEGTQSHMEVPGNHFQGYRPTNDTQQADFKVGHLRNALLRMDIHNDMELSNQIYCGLITEDNIFC